MISKLGFLMGVFAFLSGCAYSIENIDVSGSDSACVRDVLKTYSTCINGGPSIGAKTETLRACREAYQIGVNTCPTKK